MVKIIMYKKTFQEILLIFYIYYNISLQGKQNDDIIAKETLRQK